jgi:hypothetical protein
VAFYDTDDCVARLRRIIRRPAGSDFPTDADCYVYLAEGQMEIFTWLAVYCPKACIIAPTQMTLSADSKTATFGTDSALPSNYTDLYPVGAVRLYRQVGDIPSTPMADGVEYLMEGNRIRQIDGSTFSSAPWYQCLTLPTTLASSTPQPTLKPVQARTLIVSAAALHLSDDIGADTEGLATRYAQQKQDWIGALQTQYAEVGAIAATHPNGARNRWDGAIGRPYYR